MDIRHLKTLVAIAESESFMAAAERVSLTPAAVSLQMKTLEKQLDVALFDRSTRPPHLNPHGAALIERARAVLQSYEAFLEAAGTVGELAGRLALGCIAGISSDLLPRALVRLRERHPHLYIQIVEGTTTQLMHQVLRREIDAAIVTAPSVPEPELNFRPIKREPLVAIVRKQDQAPGTWQDIIAGRPFLRVNRRSGLGHVIDRGLRDAGLTVEEAMELDSTEAILQMALAGLGAGVVSASRITEALAERLTMAPFGDPPIERHVMLAQRRKTPRHHLARALYDELKSLVEADGVKKS